MSDSVYVGKNVAELARNKKFDAITGVTIEVDSETSYTVGTTTGRVLKIKNPWGTQAMATNILNAVTGYAYQPYQANDAILDPVAEIGDAITIGGIYSVIADTEITFDCACLTDVAAAQGEEIDSEYPYLPPIERKVQQAQTAASSALEKAESAQTAADNAQSDADDANEIIRGWQFPGSEVEIDGANLKADTVMASKLLGGEVGLLNQNKTQIGTLKITGASSAQYSIELSSDGALRLVGDGGSVYLYSSGGASILLDSEIRLGGGNTRPNGNNMYSIGTGAYIWTDVYAYNAEIQTSDRNAKKDIKYDVSAFDNFFANLKPVSYKFKDGKRTHIGMIAQDVKENMDEQNISSEDFAGYIEMPQEDGTVKYGLRYGEFISLNIHQIQKLMARVEQLETKLAKLEARLGAKNG